MIPVAPQQQEESEEAYRKRMQEFQDSGGYEPMLQQQALAASFGAGEGTGASVGGGYGKKRVGEQSRGQMNLTSGQSRSILTGG